MRLNPCLLAGSVLLISDIQLLISGFAVRVDYPLDGGGDSCPLSGPRSGTLNSHRYGARCSGHPCSRSGIGNGLRSGSRPVVRNGICFGCCFRLRTSPCSPSRSGVRNSRRYGPRTGLRSGLCLGPRNSTPPPSTQRSSLRPSLLHLHQPAEAAHRTGTMPLTRIVTDTIPRRGLTPAGFPAMAKRDESASACSWSGEADKGKGRHEPPLLLLPVGRYCCPRMTNSTRRLSARPSAVALSATGLASP